MKHKWPLVLCIILMSCIVLLSCGGVIFFLKRNLKPKAAVFENPTTTSKKVRNTYTSGSIFQNVYTNSWLELQYKPIDGMEFLDSESMSDFKLKLNKDISEKDASLSCDVGLFSMSDSERMVLFIWSLDCSNVLEDAMIKEHVKGIGNCDNARYSKQKLGDIEFVKVSDIKLQSSDPCVVLAKIIDSKLVTIVMYNASEERANEMLTGFSKMEKANLDDYRRPMEKLNPDDLGPTMDYSELFEDAK